MYWFLLKKKCIKNVIRAWPGVVSISWTNKEVKKKVIIQEKEREKKSSNIILETQQRPHTNSERGFIQKMIKKITVGLS